MDKKLNKALIEIFSGGINMKVKFFLSLLCFVLLISCVERRIYLPDREEKKDITKKEDKIQVEDIKPTDKPEKKEEIPLTQIDEVKKKVEEKIGDIYFDYDKYDIRPTDIPTLKKVASMLQKNPKLRVIIEGHCDERGTNEYNFALGQKRANSAKQYLIILGVPASKIDIVSYGEEKPLCTEQNELCWQKNRRAHFVFIEEGK